MQTLANLLKRLVGASGFEPPTSWSRTRMSENLKPCGCRAYVVEPLQNPPSVVPHVTHPHHRSHADGDRYRASTNAARSESLRVVRAVWHCGGPKGRGTLRSAESVKEPKTQPNAARGGSGRQRISLLQWPVDFHFAPDTEVSMSANDHRDYKSGSPRCAVALAGSIIRETSIKKVPIPPVTSSYGKNTQCQPAPRIE